MAFPCSHTWPQRQALCGSSDAVCVCACVCVCVWPQYISHLLEDCYVQCYLHEDLLTLEGVGMRVHQLLGGIVDSLIREIVYIANLVENIKLTNQVLPYF